MESVCEKCFSTVNVRQSAIGKRYRCKVCGAVCVVEPPEDTFDDHSDYSPRPRKRPSNKSRKKKRSRSRATEASNIRGVGFGCLYAILIPVVFLFVCAFLLPAIFHGQGMNMRALGQLFGMIGFYVVAPISAVVGFMRHRKPSE